MMATQAENFREATQSILDEQGYTEALNFLKNKGYTLEEAYLYLERGFIGIEIAPHAQDAQAITEAPKSWGKRALEWLAAS